ncbi:hypothetical protein BU14_0399s0016 [Porphyra umbilicalis]|uniref:Uncharacterized protein n=1 Tax=Porphyra umbilicalis TaxID=2786 RepID=A0A1X6NWB7_PORUM|nr:hypothetical protein BU14_0399s0016 [Porphyra umbilicalis]|eukprot:OSX72872.1 hypothetical protein BU14_0399s0016 [Porphyra umbilicalis]
MEPRRLHSAAFSGADRDAVWYPILVDAFGVETARPGGVRTSAVVAELLVSVEHPVTDVFLFAHGLGCTTDGAVAFHEGWIQSLFYRRAKAAAAAANTARRGAAATNGAPPPHFHPLFIGLCWRSDQWAPTTWTEAMDARRMVPAVTQAVATVAAAPAGVVLPSVAAAASAAISAGVSVSYLKFGRFEERAVTVGVITGKALLAALHDAEALRVPPPGAPLPPAVRYHAIGHSLGCHVLSAAVQAAAAGRTGDRRLLSTLVLVQGAVPSTAFSPAGAYHRVPDWVAGSVLVTHTDTDAALWLYERYHRDGRRALGSEGARVELSARVHPPPRMGDLSTLYDGRLLAGRVANVDASIYLRPSSAKVLDWYGGHCKYLEEELQHLIWAALAVTIPSPPPPQKSPQLIPPSPADTLCDSAGAAAAPSQRPRPPSLPHWAKALVIGVLLGCFSWAEIGTPSAVVGRALLAAGAAVVRWAATGECGGGGGGGATAAVEYCA